jgi:IMP dehydrogenase
MSLKKFLTFDDVGLIPKFNSIKSRLDTKLTSKITQTIRTEIPFIPANMDTVMGTKMASLLKENGGIGIFHRFASVETRLYWLTNFPNFFQSCGITDWNNTIILINAGCKNFCIDIAHGHSGMVGEMIEKIKNNVNDAQIIAGNICTPDGFRYLVDCGADCIKLGVGPGSACSTRMVTGVGVPQFSAIQSVAQKRDEYFTSTGKYIPIIADGGIRDSRDVCLALAAGADTVMMGMIFCKTFESECKKIIESDGTTYGIYRGQASANFQNDYFGMVKKGTVPEGIDFKIKIVKSAQEIIDNFMGSLRSSFTYLGAENMKEYHENAEFFESTINYLPESKPRKEENKNI